MSQSLDGTAQYDHGVNCPVSCTQGFHLAKGPTSPHMNLPWDMWREAYCDDGQWYSPVCVEHVCNMTTPVRPSTPTSGEGAVSDLLADHIPSNINHTSLEVCLPALKDSSCLLSCESGYELSGSLRCVLGDDASTGMTAVYWESPLLSCHPKGCTGLPEVKHHASFSPNEDQFNHTESVSITCRNGEHFIATCEYGVWINVGECKPKACTQPKMYDARTEGSKDLSCDPSALDGYGSKTCSYADACTQYRVPNTLTCVDGEWSWKTEIE